jgi:hypothetical protein
MKADRVAIRAGVALGVVVAVAVALVALTELGGTDPATWATLAAALAVIAALTSAWTGQRMVELHEDAAQPNPVPSIDLLSRYGLAQFRITNHGGSVAHDVLVKWDKPLLDEDGQAVGLGSESAIPALGPGQSASVLLGQPNSWLNKTHEATFNGSISFKNSSGDDTMRPFVMSAEHQRQSLTHDEEEPRTLYDIQKIPGALEQIAAELRQLRENGTDSD